MSSLRRSPTVETPDPPKVVRRNTTENVLVNSVLAKGRCLLVETEIAKPPAEVHGRAPHRLSTIAQRRDSVQLGAPGPCPRRPSEIALSRRGGQAMNKRVLSGGFRDLFGNRNMPASPAILVFRVRRQPFGRREPFRGISRHDFAQALCRWPFQ